MRCALIGCGYWGSILKSYIEESSFFDLVAVCDSKSDLNKVWSDKSIEAVVIATPIETHYVIVKAALLSGKHVFSEKPLALRSEECRELKLLAKRKNLVLHIDYVFTFSKSLAYVRSLIGTEDVGELLAMEMNVKHLGRFGRQDVYWLLASHMFSVLSMFCPLKLLNFCFVDLIKNETGTIFFDGNLKGSINVSLNYPWKEANIIFYCEKASIQYNPNEQFTLKIVYYKKREWTIQANIPKKADVKNLNEKHNLRHAIKSFANCVSGRENSNIDLAVQITEILENH